MKYIHIITLLLFINMPLSMEDYWRPNTARIIEKKRWEVGLFQPLRYGYSEKIELSTHPIIFFVMPNISIKKQEKKLWKFDCASKISFRYPTPLLNIFSREGTGGLIDPNLQFPPMVGFSYSWIMTRLKNGFDITIKNGIDFGLSFGSLDKRGTIDLPLVYHRVALYENGWGYHSGIDIQRRINKSFSLLFDIDFLILPRLAVMKSDPDFDYLLGLHSLEHKVLLSWEKSKSFKVTTGYKLVSSELPFGNQKRLLPYIPLFESWVPIIELQWAGVKK